MKKLFITSCLIFSTMLLFGQTDCSDCPFVYHLTTTEYCSEINVECGETFTLTFNKCPIEDGNKFCSFCNDIDAFVNTYNSNISVLGSQDNGNSVTYTFQANIVEGQDCYQGCISFWPCGIECEWLGMCYENSLAYHYKVNVCGCPVEGPCEDYTLWECLSSPCECLRMCVDDTQVVFNNTTGDEAFICFPEGSVISNVVSCEEDIDCGGDPQDKINQVQIPESNVVAYNTVANGVDIDLKLPESKVPYELIVTDANGNTVKQESISGMQNTVRLRDISSGIYFINIDNGSTAIRHKVFLGN